MSNQAAITVKNVSKQFVLPHEKKSSIKSVWLSAFKLNKKTTEKQRVLKDISFNVNKGEFFGIVGKNGSGKSTLLKLLAGIYAPDQGSIRINGRLTPFIELGVGFNPELTGKENVYLNGALLGFNRKQMSEMYNDIVDFAELDKFMDQKLKNYSSGMQVRLAFSIAIRAETDILLFDEVLAVGDAAFQSKCFEVFAQLKDAGRTIVLVTHDMGAVLRFCDRALLVDSGKIIDMGKPSDVADEYLQLNYDRSNKVAKDEVAHNYIDGATIVRRKTGKKLDAISSGESLSVNVAYSNPGNEKLHFGLQLFSDGGVYCFGTNTKIFGNSPVTASSGEVSIKLSNIELLPGTYAVTLAVMNASATNVLEYRPKILEFRRTKDTEVEGVAMIEHEWSAK